MKKILAIFIFAFIAAIPLVTMAQDFVPLTNLPGIEEAAASDTLPSFFNNLYKLCIGAAAVIAVLQIMRAGAYFMFNKGSIAHNEKGKGLIMNALLGLLLVLSPAIVFGIINPDILDLKLDFSEIKTEQQATSTPYSSPLEQPGCSHLDALRTIDREAGKDAADICPALGSGWHGTHASCCAITSNNQVCCGYDRDLDRTINAPPPAPEDADGDYSYEYMISGPDYDTGGRCVLRDTRYYATKEACTTAVAQVNLDGQTAVREHCNCPSGATGCTYNLQWTPSNVKTELDKLPLCTE